MLKRALLSLLTVGLLLVALVGIEVVVAIRREYLPTEPALDIGGVFGGGSDRLTLVVLGDSTGAGVGAGTAEKAYPTVLARTLARRTGKKVRLIDFAISGARVRDVVEDQVPRALEEDASAFLVVIGANDVTHLSSLSSVRDGTTEIARRLGATGTPVVVAGAPDMRAPAFAEPLRSIVGWRGEVVTDAIEETAGEEGAMVVPLADETRDYFISEPDRHYSADLFHPSAAGYRRWADVLYPAVEQAITHSADD